MSARFASGAETGHKTSAMTVLGVYLETKDIVDFQAQRLSSP